MVPGVAAARYRRKDPCSLYDPGATLRLWSPKRSAPDERRDVAPSLRDRLANRGIDTVTLMALPALLFMLRCSSIPSSMALVLSFNPEDGRRLANYVRFFTEPFLADDLPRTFGLAVAGDDYQPRRRAADRRYRMRLLRRYRVLTTILVLPITLGTVLVAEGLLTYLGPQGWFNSAALMIFGGPASAAAHNYWGVRLSLFITGFPFTFC